MAKSYFLNQAKSFKPENEGTFFQGVMKRKIQEKSKEKTESRFAKRKQKMNSLKIKC